LAYETLKFERSRKELEKRTNKKPPVAGSPKIADPEARVAKKEQGHVIEQGIS
jgi:hypothetical protein